MLFTHDNPCARVGQFWSLHPIPAQALECLRSLDEWYTEERVACVLVPFCTQTSRVSLRVLDWLVTNYSKKHHIVLRKQSTAPFNIHDEYEMARDQRRRSMLDPFRRQTKRLKEVFLRVGDDILHTTVGQLNFLYWAEVSGVIAFALEHSVAIEQDMNESMQHAKRTKEAAKRIGLSRKRSELSQKPTAVCFVYEGVVRMKFETAQPE